MATNPIDRVRESIATSSLLFNSSPEIGAWETTRALSPEIVAFKNDPAGINRLSVEYFEAGETDEDGHYHAQDTWYLICRGSEWGEERFTDRDEMLLALAALMAEITEEGDR